MAYDSNSIEEKTDIEHIRLRPGMYIGNLDNASKLFDEVFDNSLDEAQNNFCSSVSVEQNGAKIIVSDDGRGIPVKGHTLKKIVTKLFTSGKFNDDSYDVSAGLHGIGLTSVNALSKEMCIESFDSSKMHGKLILTDQKVTSDVESPYKKKPTGTTISFIPDGEIFRSPLIPNAYIQSRIKLASALLSTTKFVFDNKEITYKMCDYVKDEIEVTNDKIDIRKIVCNSKPEKLEIFFCFEETNISKGAMNIKPCNQGTHINFARNIIVNRILSDDKSLTTRDVFNLKIFVNGSLKQTNYTSQTKEHLDIDKDIFVTKFKNKFEKELDKMIKSNRDWWDSVVSKIIAHKHFLESKKSISVSSGGKRSQYVSVEGLKDCSKFDGTNELFICEGKSAGGGLIATRDAKIHAILSLKGKVLNVENNDFAKFLQNKELKGLFTALGTGVKTGDKDEDSTKLRYGKVILVVDADSDGKHIALLLLTCLNKFTPSLIREGKVFIADMPLFGYTKNKKFIPIFDLDEANELRANGITVSRFKGLGEMDPNELKASVIDVKTRKLIKVDPSVDMERIVSLLTTAEKKKQLLQECSLIAKNL